MLDGITFRGYICGMMGRPKKPPGEVRANVLRIRLTDSERARLDRVAGDNGGETSSWAREMLLGAAAVTEKKKGQQSGRARQS